MSSGPVLLHVGLMKTGTTFLQSVLRANASALERQGLSLVPGNQVQAHRLAMDLRGLTSAGSGLPEAAGTLARLPKELAGARGDRCVLSEETLARLSVEHVARLGEALGGREAHLVVTVRDIARTIPSAWQQAIKGGRGYRYDAYVDQVVKHEGPRADGFWAAYDVPTILRRWEALVPPERVHVVTLPPPGADPAVLLERFCSVIGVDAASLAEPAARGNESLGRVQAEVLRRMNRRLSDDAKRREFHGAVVKRGFALGVLAPQGGDRIRLPAEHATWAAEYAAALGEALVGGGYDVVGDVADLVPVASSFGEAGRVGDAEVADVAVQTLVDLIEEQAAAWDAERAGARKGGDGGETAVGRIGGWLRKGAR